MLSKKVLKIGLVVPLLLVTHTPPARIRSTSFAMTAAANAASRTTHKRTYSPRGAETAR